MTYCSACDYYRNTDGTGAKKEPSAKAVCSFAGTVIFEDTGKPGGEYPCKDMSYQEYLNREKKPVSVLKLKQENWKLLYKSRHPVLERSRNVQCMGGKLIFSKSSRT